MPACSCGEMLTRSVQENAANKTAVIRTRAQDCERPERFIGLGACDNGWVCASNFPGSVHVRSEKQLPRRLISRFRLRCDSRLERDTMIGFGRFRDCPCADPFRPFGVLVVGVLI